MAYYTNVDQYYTATEETNNIPQQSSSSTTTTRPPPHKYQQYFNRLNRDIKPTHPYKLRLWLQLYAEDEISKPRYRNILNGTMTSSTNNNHNITMQSSSTATLSSSSRVSSSTQCLYNALKEGYILYQNGFSYIKETRPDPTQKDIDTVFDRFQKVTLTYDDDSNDDNSNNDDELNVLYDEGLMLFIEKHCHLPKTSLTLLLLSYLFQTKCIGEITRNEFTKGCVEYKIIAVKSFLTFCNDAYNDLTSANYYLRDLYHYSFYVANNGAIMTTLSLSKAISIWNQIFPLFPQFKTYKDIIEWLKIKLSTTTSSTTTTLLSSITITRDFYNNLYDFGLVMKDDYETNYSFTKDDGWNSLLDQFVIDFLDLEIIDNNNNVVDIEYYNTNNNNNNYNQDIIISSNGIIYENNNNNNPCIYNNDEITDLWL